MAYLGKYIRQILSRKEAVVLPGFGSLVLEEGKGVQREDGRIDPPGAVVRFDATHPKEDGRLADEYAAGEGLDQEEARQQVLELVDAIKFRLDKGETYKLDMVGEFSRDDDNRVHFAKDPNWVIDPELFGLSALDLLELEDTEKEKSVDESVTEPGTADAEQGRVAGKDVSTQGTGVTEAQQSEKAGATTTGKEKAGAAAPGTKKAASMHSPAPRKESQQRKVQRKPVNKWRIIWIVAGSLIVVLALILLIPSGNGIEVGKEGIIIRDTEIGNGTGEGSETGTEQQQSQGSDVQEDLGAAATESLQEEQEPEEGPVQPPVQEYKYFIIAGSFRNLGNATEMMDELKAAGYPAEIILTENRLYRVSVKSFATKQEALNALPSVKSKDGLGSAWLLTR